MRSIAQGGATVLFVSHNLKAVSDLCERTMLLEAGNIAADGATADVIQAYLEQERAKVDSEPKSDVAIRAVAMRGTDGCRVHFRPGDKAWVDVTFEAIKPCQRIAVVIAVLGDGLIDVFDTSSERLGTPPVDLDAGQSCTVSFELTMHLAPGTFHVAVYLYRYDLQREYDKSLSAATFFVESEIDVRGAANLYPRIVACEKS